jgi:hypothetical protein
MQRPLPIAISLMALAGCAPFLGRTRDPAYNGNGPGAMALPPLVAYQDSRGPLSYRAAVSDEQGLREVSGVACQSGLMLPVALVWSAIESGNVAAAPAFLSAGWGEGDYAAAAAKALASSPGMRLVNVRADLQTRIILGVWRQQCVRVTANVAPVR